MVSQRFARRLNVTMVESLHIFGVVTSGNSFFQVRGGKCRMRGELHFALGGQIYKAACSFKGDVSDNLCRNRRDHCELATPRGDIAEPRFGSYRVFYVGY